MDLQQLLTKAAEFVFSPVDLEEMDRKRQSFLNKFPNDSFPHMTAAQYADTRTKDCFIYWLEHKDVLGGIGGGNASKFGIYRAGNGEYCKGVGSKKVFLQAEELDEEFNQLREGYIQAIESAKQEQWKQLEDLQLPVFNMVLLKILNLYVPEKFFNIYSASILLQLGKRLEIDPKWLKPEYIVLLNHQILQKLKEKEVFSRWSNDQISQFLWQTLSSKDEIDPLKGYWLAGYTYSDEGSQKDWFMANHCMGIGFLREDLSDYLQEEEIERFIEEKDIEPRAQRALRQFFQIKEGDLVALKSTFVRKVDGKSVSILKVSAIGRITQDAFNGGYHFDPDHGHLLPVEWIDREESEFNGLGGGYQRTLNQVRDKQVIQQVFFKKNRKPQNPDTAKEKRPWAKNYVLYGPPGTGKTYQVSELALQLINEKTYYEVQNNGRKAIQDEFNRLIQEGQIHFVTFHQSYSYEDFIEGLKSDGKGSFVPTNGLFKDVVLEATYEGIHKSNEVLSDEVRFQRLYRYLAENGIKDGIRFTSMTGAESFISQVSPQGNLVVTTEGAKSSSIVSKARLAALFKYVKENQVDWKENLGFIRDAIGGCNQTWYWSVLNWILTKLDEEETEEESVELESTDKNALVQQALLDREQLRFDKVKNYVLIIDEMNRGNISKIFGELLTLLEEDKRLTEENEIKVELPYSKDKFALPPNLYIIGTMNTADRSIALLDTALRRRFVFQEIMPDPEQLDTIGEIDLEAMLTIMNQRIEVLHSRDHMIGHAYFIQAKTEDEVISIFENKIIPLLQEYFYEDWEKIGLVLGGIGNSKEDRFIIYEEKIQIEALFKQKPSLHLPPLYRVKKKLTAQEIIAIYE